MLCPLCEKTSRSGTCLKCQKKYEADLRAGRIPELLTAESYDYGTWEKVQLRKRYGIAKGLSDEEIIKLVRVVTDERAKQYTKILQARAEEAERQKRLREGLADKNRFNF